LTGAFLPDLWNENKVEMKPIDLKMKKTKLMTLSGAKKKVKWLFT
jgi:hypothetical protein